MRKLLVLVAAALLGSLALEAAPRKVPAAAVKNLKITRGKPIRTGMVFMDGEFISAPYTVERYGTALRINGKQITGPLVPWDEFLKTQAGAKVTTSTTEVPAEAGAPEPEEPEEELFEDDEDDDPLAALFDDEPKPKKAKPKKAAKKKKPAGPRQVTTTKVEFDGDFEMNPACQKMVDRINSRRTMIDQNLRNGGFYFFGSGYSGANGDAALAMSLLKVLPEAIRGANSGDQLHATLRAKGFPFVSAAICQDLMAHRSDYVKLIELRKKLEADAQFNSLIKGR